MLSYFMLLVFFIVICGYMISALILLHREIKKYGLDMLNGFLFILASCGCILTGFTAVIFGVALIGKLLA